jgi:hypothetical protein
VAPREMTIGFASCALLVGMLQARTQSWRASGCSDPAVATPEPP